MSNFEMDYAPGEPEMQRDAVRLHIFEIASSVDLTESMREEIANLIADMSERYSHEHRRYGRREYIHAGYVLPKRRVHVLHQITHENVSTLSEGDNGFGTRITGIARVAN